LDLAKKLLIFRKRRGNKKSRLNKRNNENTDARLTHTFFGNLSIGMKYTAVFLFSVVLFIIATLTVYFQLSLAKNDVDAIITNSELMSTMTDMTLLIEQQHSAITSYAIMHRDEYIEEYNRMNDELGKIFDELDDRFIGSEEENIYKEIKENVHTITYLFHGFLIPKAEAGENVTSLLLEVDMQKVVLINLISELLQNDSKKQKAYITNVENSMNNSILYLFLINTSSIVLGLTTLIVISRYMSNHLKQVVNTAVKISIGDLTIEPLPYKRKDEIGLLSNAVNSLRQHMRSIIENVKNASSSVSSSSETLMRASKDVNNNSRQMVSTMEELAAGADAQAESAAHLSGQMDAFLRSVQQSQADGEAVVQSSKHVLSLTKEGTALMKQSVAQMHAIDEVVSKSVEKMKGLDQKSEQISHLVDVVKDIADQTNLLALNAAIEAARAGEHGRGFAVVAEEVRKLAEEVAASVSEITNIVTSIQSETDEVVKTLNTGYKEVKLGARQIEKTGDTFKTIEHFIQNMVESIAAVAGRLKDIAKNSKQMNAFITDIATVSKEAAAGVEQALAETQQTSSAIVEITANAERLAELAHHLHNKIGFFKV